MNLCGELFLLGEGVNEKTVKQAKKMKALLISLLFVIGFSQGGCVLKVGCRQGDCIIGNGTYVWTSGIKYSGGWRDGKRNGYGTMTYPDGAIYEGQWKDDKRNGYGTFTFSDGSVYDGEWKDGKRDGQGFTSFSGGRKCLGQWKDGKFIKTLTSYEANKPQRKKFVKDTSKKPQVKTEAVTPQQKGKGKKQDACPYTIQVSSFKDKERSNSVVMALRKKGDPAFTCLTRIPGKGDWYRVYIGSYRTFEETQAAALKLKRRKHLYPLAMKVPYAVQVGVSSYDKELKEIEADLESKGYLAYRIPDRRNRGKTRLLIGAFKTEKGAARLTGKLQEEGFDPKVVRR
jgi:cell division septation protein DedD